MMSDYVPFNLMAFASVSFVRHFLKPFQHLNLPSWIDIFFFSMSWMDLCATWFVTRMYMGQSLPFYII